MGLFLGSLFCSIDPRVCLLHQYQTVFDYYSFVVYFEIRGRDNSSFVLS